MSAPARTVQAELFVPFFFIEIAPNATPTWDEAVVQAKGRGGR